MSSSRRRHLVALATGLLTAAPLPVASPAGAEESRPSSMVLYAGVQVAALDLGPSAIINRPTSGAYGKKIRAHITWSDTNTPIAGVRVNFYIDDEYTHPTPFCTAVTDATGNARCTATNAQFAQLVAANGITAITDDPVIFHIADNRFICALDCSNL